MLNRTVLAAAFLACPSPSVPVPEQEEIPTSLSAFTPHEVVEAFTAEAKSLALTPEQRARVDSLHVAVRDERHRWTATPGNKAHKGVKMKPMISREKAYRPCRSTPPAVNPRAAHETDRSLQSRTADAPTHRR
jgi:hypothetical protein